MKITGKAPDYFVVYGVKKTRWHNISKTIDVGLSFNTDKWLANRRLVILLVNMNNVP